MVVVFLLACAALWFLDILHTAPPPEGIKCKARILSVDNSNIFKIGLLQKGEQHVRLIVLSGPFKGRQERTSVRSHPLIKCIVLKL